MKNLVILFVFTALCVCATTAQSRYELKRDTVAVDSIQYEVLAGEVTNYKIIHLLTNNLLNSDDYLGLYEMAILSPEMEQRADEITQEVFRDYLPTMRINRNAITVMCMCNMKGEICEVSFSFTTDDYLDSLPLELFAVWEEMIKSQLKCSGIPSYWDKPYIKGGFDVLFDELPTATPPKHNGILTTTDSLSTERPRFEW